MLPVVITIRISVDTRGRIPKAELAAAFVVSTVRAKLGAVKSRKQAAATCLPSDGSQSILRACWSGSVAITAFVKFRKKVTARVRSESVQGRA